jgi:hypothetical protein
MNTQAIEKKMQAYYDTATSEQILKEFEDLGVEFVYAFTFKDMRRIVKLYQASLEIPELQSISKADHKRMAQTFVELDLKYECDE